jgi:phospholipid/cholesterol/gamma-HCH transport system substrate-binding protein
MDRRYYTAIGLTVVVALALVIRALIFLHPTPGDGGTVLHVRFQTVDKIGPGSRVTFAGRPVGEVEKVILLPEAFYDRSSRPIYPYEVTLSIDSSVKTYRSDEISIQTEGLMGEHYIAITPRPPAPGDVLTPIGSTDLIFARASRSADETLHEISTVAKRADQTMEAMTSLIDRNQEGIFQTTESIRLASQELHVLLATLNQGRFGENLVDVSRKSLECIEKFNHLSEILTRATTDEGTLARVMKDPCLYDTMLDCTQRIQQLVSDMNTYGLLFHTNRDWQRMNHLRPESPAMAIPVAGTFSPERFVKMSHSMSELRRTLLAAQDALKRTDVLGWDSLSTSLSDVQTQIDTLQELMAQMPFERGDGQSSEGSS